MVDQPIRMKQISQACIIYWIPAKYLLLLLSQFVHAFNLFIDDRSVVSTTIILLKHEIK